MLHILASLLGLCFTATSYCASLTDAIAMSVFAIQVMALLLLGNPLPLVLSLLIGTGIFYWFLKSISLARAFAYALINLMSSIIGLFIFLVIRFKLVIEPSYNLAPLAAVMLIAINILIMHQLFKYPYKKISLPIILDTVIRIILITLLSKPMLGP